MSEYRSSLSVNKGRARPEQLKTGIPLSSYLEPFISDPSNAGVHDGPRMRVIYSFGLALDNGQGRMGTRLPPTSHGQNTAPILRGSCREIQAAHSVAWSMDMETSR